MKSNFLRDCRPIVIPANREVRLPGRGTLFICYRASFPFQVSFDDNGFNDARSGVQICTGEDFFQTVTLKNDTAVDCIVEVSIGKGGAEPYVKYDYLVDRTIRQRETQVATGQTAGGYPGIATDTAGPGQQRISLIVMNTANASDEVIVMTTQAWEICRVLRESSVILPLTQEVYIYNYSGAIATVVEQFTR